jgi:uncharacterized lipoprotein YddW (UPF0748 family)
MLRDPAPEWGEQGVRQILDRCKECGWDRVYWRCFDGGKALYPSKLMDPAHGYDEENYHRDHGSTWVLDKLKDLDWGSYDAFKEAVTYGHEIGIEVHAWLSINEDDHGYGLVSRFTKEHPEFRWVGRDGRVYRSQLSFAFPQVRAYKIALVREILSYGPDGIFFDWIRTGDVRDNPHTDKDGVASYGYETPNLERFKALHGVDPETVPNGDERWVRVRAEPQTIFMREAHALIEEHDPKMSVSALVHHRWAYRGSPTDTPYADSLRGLLVDLPTWAEEGLVDEVVAAGYYRQGGTPELGYQAMREETQGKVDVWLFGWIGSKDQFLADVKLAERLGASQLLLWESDYICMPPAKADVVEAMRGYGATE